MSQTDTQATEPLVKEQLALLIERELRYQLDDILKRMQKLAKDFRIDTKKDRFGKIVQDKKAERSPLRNLLVTATDRTASLEIIKNYISYQTARSDDVSAILKNAYEGEERNPYQSNKFGRALIEALDNLEQDAEAILENVKNSQSEGHPVVQYLSTELREREVTDLHLKLAQLYLGYLVREHTAMRGA